MERFSQRESVLLGYNNFQRPFPNMNHKTSKPFRNSDVDFHDVFGGPPRRFSMQEFRPAFKTIDAASTDDDDDDDTWSSSDMPVFGDDGVSRRKLPSADFFNDIFGGDAAVNSTPKRSGRDHVFPASPGSRGLSPLPPSKADTFGSSSLLSQFSLPAKVSKALEVPAFGSSSSSRSQNKHNKGSSSPNGITHSLSSATSLSRFSSQESSKKDSESSGGSSANNSGHFHFSIYKWASKGVPLDIPRRGKTGGSSKPKEVAAAANNNKTTPLVDSSSSNGHTVPNFPSPTFVHHSNGKLQNGLPLSEVAAEEAIPNGIKDEPADKTISETSKEEPRKSEAKPVQSLFYDDLERGLDETSPKAGGQDNTSTDKVRKTQERKNASSEGDRVRTVPVSPRRENNGKSRVRGRVKEFVKMFNQDVPQKSAAKDGFKFRSRSCNWKEKPTFEDEQMIDTIMEEEKFPMPKINEDLKQSAKVHACEHDTSTQYSDSISVGSKTTVEETDESVQDNFQVKEITQMESDTPKNQELKDIDAKIRQWTKGKEGNIRSLLSTLQYVLWAESGWKAVPLVDIIEGNAVKRAYQRALLCLHPDKLQQKGVASHQKYLAEKVFGILQEAWNYFNSLGAV